MRPMPFLGPSASTSASVPVALQLPLRRRLGDLELQLPLRRRLGDPEAAIWAAQRTSSLKFRESPSRRPNLSQMAAVSRRGVRGGWKCISDLLYLLLLFDTRLLVLPITASGSIIPAATLSRCTAAAAMSRSFWQSAA